MNLSRLDLRHDVEKILVVARLAGIAGVGDIPIVGALIEYRRAGATAGMAIAPDGKSLYLVNYVSQTVTKIRCADMHVLQVVSANAMPIGITYVDATHDVWVSCYSGVVMVFHDG